MTVGDFRPEEDLRPATEQLGEHAFGTLGRQFSEFSGFPGRFVVLAFPSRALFIFSAFPSSLDGERSVISGLESAALKASRPAKPRSASGH